ncbi:MAG TPA: hypothetical protein VEV43_14170 [Actinomycetota bacterium]|nr:hypothetical protein [Actinomycetota bacterium]
MRKLVASACLAGALLLPVAPASADERPGAGVEDCRDYGGGYYGVWAWYYDLENDYHRIWTCIYLGP